jgi:hypothetical protein
VRNPFPYQRPVLPEQMIDREQETATLLSWCDDGLLIRLDAPRRYGKTSLVRKVFAEAEKDGSVGVLCDLTGVLTLTDIITRLGRSYAVLRGPVAKMLRPVLLQLEVEFGVSFMGAGASAKLAGRQVNEEAALFALLDLPGRFTEKGWQRVIVCFDEFQDVLAVDRADDKLRSQIQHQGADVAYIFAGSEPRLMNELFARTRAFWSQAQPLELQPLAAAPTAGYVTARFGESGREAGEALAPLVGTNAGHPQRTMFLASKLWSLTPEGGEATLETWQQALRESKLQEENALESEWRSLSGPAQRVLRATALNDGRPYRRQAFEGVGLPQGSVARAVRQLVDSYQLREVDQGQFSFVDPLFELYVRDLASDTLPEESEEE